MKKLTLLLLVLFVTSCKAQDVPKPTPDIPNSIAVIDVKEGKLSDDYSKKYLPEIYKLSYQNQQLLKTIEQLVLGIEEIADYKRQHDYNYRFFSVLVDGVKIENIGTKTITHIGTYKLRDVKGLEEIKEYDYLIISLADNPAYVFIRNYN